MTCSEHESEECCGERRKRVDEVVGHPWKSTDPLSAAGAVMLWSFEDALAVRAVVPSLERCPKEAIEDGSETPGNDNWPAWKPAWGEEGDECSATDHGEGPEKGDGTGGTWWDGTSGTKRAWWAGTKHTKLGRPRIGRSSRESGEIGQRVVAVTGAEEVEHSKCGGDAAIGQDLHCGSWSTRLATKDGEGTLACPTETGERAGGGKEADH